MYQGCPSQRGHMYFSVAFSVQATLTISPQLRQTRYIRLFMVHTYQASYRAPLGLRLRGPW